MDQSSRATDTLNLAADLTLMGLDREAARRIFGCRQSGEWAQVLSEFVHEFRQMPERIWRLGVERGPFVARCRSHRLLQELIEPTRPLWTNQELQLALIRPDLVPQLLQAWTMSRPQADVSSLELSPPEVQHELEELDVWLHSAAEQQWALLVVIPTHFLAE